MNQLNANRRKPVVKLTAEDIVGPQGPGRLIRCLYRQMVSLSEAQFPETDLSFIHWLSLMLVHDGVVVTAGDLAKETMMTTGAITRLVDVLEDRRLLIRDRCAADPGLRYELTWRMFQVLAGRLQDTRDRLIARSAGMGPSASSS